MSTLLSILEVLSTVTAIMVALSPAPDFWHIYKNRSTGNVSILPVVMIFCNCYAWVLYAYQVSNFVPLFTICTVGMLTSIMFGSIYYRGSNDHAYVHKVCGVAFVVLAIYTLYYILGTSGVTNQSDDAVEKTLGILSDVINVVLNASPLETMKKVIQTKDASTIPIILSTIFLVNAAVWVTYAIADDDMFVLLPNALGVLFCIAQVVLYLIYLPRNAKKASVGTGNEEVHALGSPNSHAIQASMSPDFVSLKENSAV